MTGYLVNHEKAERVFSKRETQLKHAIKNDHAQEKIVKAAEQLREAKLKVFKARFSQKSVLPASSWEPNEEARQWQSLPVEGIIEKYRKKA